MRTLAKVFTPLVWLAALIILPLLGVRLSGEPVSGYLEFPPRTQVVDHAGFSRPVFVVLAVLAAGFVLFFDVRCFRARRGIAPAPARYRLPWWGWAGLVCLGLAWTAAWTRLPWLRPVQRYTFAPLWIGYVVVAHALTYRRKRATP